MNLKRLTRLFLVLSGITLIYILLNLIFIKTKSQRTKKNINDLLNLYHHDCSPDSILRNKRLTASESYLLGVFDRHFNSFDMSNLSSLIVSHPRGRSGLGNNLWRLMNTLALSIATKSSIFIHPSLGFYDPEKYSFFMFLRPRSQKLCELMQFPPIDSKLRNFIAYDSKQNIWDEKVFSNIWEVDLWEYALDRENYKYFLDGSTIFEVSEKERDGFPEHTYAPLLRYNDCHFHVCERYIAGEEGDSDSFSLPIHEDGKQVFQLHDWVNGWYGHHIFKSRRNRHLFCDELGLCEGMDLSTIEKNDDQHQHPLVGYRYYGFLLYGRLFRSIFDFNRFFHDHEFSEQMKRIYPSNRNEENTVLVSIQLRTHYVGKNTEPFLNCVKKVSNHIFLSNKKKKIKKEIKFFITSDDNKLKKKLSSEIDKYSSSNNLKISSHIIDVGESDQTQLMQKPSDYNIKKQLLLDLYLMSKSDINVITQSSTFGFWGVMMNDNFLFRNQKPFIIPVEQVLNLDVKGYQKKRYFPNSHTSSCYLMDDPNEGNIGMQFTTEEYL